MVYKEDVLSSPEELAASYLTYQPKVAIENLSNMAGNISLMSYLQTALPAIPTNPPANPSSNTMNSAYRAEDIHSISSWNGFNLNTILQRYRNVLEQARLPADAMPTSPPRAIPAENALRSKVSEYVIPIVQQALQCGFVQLAAANLMGGKTCVSFDVGEMARVIDNYKPDTAYFKLAKSNSPNRAPGDMKPSWKWNTAMASYPVPGVRSEYCQALSQENWYMIQHRSRYGFILTDRELLVFQWIDSSGSLQLAQPILVTAGGTATNPQPTVLLALWYLGMLASQDEGADHWYM